MIKHTIKPTLQFYLFLFFLVSIGGFFWEILLQFFQSGTLCKRGFFYGPWLPIYGTGAVLILFLLHSLSHSPIRCFLYSAVLGSVVELFLGIYLYHTYGLRYWDYSECVLNYNGFICLYSFLGFGISGCLFLCYWYQPLYRLWYRIPSAIRTMLLLIFSFLFLFDGILALLIPHTGPGITG